MSIDDMKSLVKAVMAEAERDSERIISHAQSEARRIKEKAQSDAASEASVILKEAEEKVDHLLLEAKASAHLEAQSLKLEKRESMISAVFEKAAQHFTSVNQISNYGSVVYGLIEDAIARMESVERIIIDTDVLTRAYIDQDKLGKLGHKCNCRLQMGDILSDTVGVIVHSTDGRLVYDNTFQARLDRMRPSLRPLVFQILKGRDL